MYTSTYQERLRLTYLKRGDVQRWYMYYNVFRNSLNASTKAFGEDLTI